MKEKMKNNRASQFIIAALELVLGIICMLKPDSAADFIVSLIGIVILAVGIVIIVSRLKDEVLRVPAIIVGAIIAAIGIYIFTKPDRAEIVFFIAFGVLILADAIQEMTASMAIRAAGGGWGFPFVLSVISMVLGVICIFSPRFPVRLGLVVIGLMLIYDAIVSIYSSIKANRADKGYVDSHIVDEKDI